MTPGRRFGACAARHLATAWGLLALTAAGAELVTLSPENYDAVAPPGKQATAICGDYVFRNERIVAVIGDPDFNLGRSAGRLISPFLTGGVMDLTLRDRPNDLLDVYYPAADGARQRLVDTVRPRGAALKQEEFEDETRAHLKPGRQPTRAPRVALNLAFEAPAKEVRYVLEDGWPYLQIETVYTGGANPRARIRSGPMVPGALLHLGPEPNGRLGNRQWDVDETGTLFWAYDPWFGQAYGVEVEGRKLALASKAGGLWLRFAEEGKGAAGAACVVTQRLFVGCDAFEVRAAAAAARGLKTLPLRLLARAPDGPVAGADVTALRDGARWPAPCPPGGTNCA